ncbi:hypothetical protein D9613_011689 [Agrocybe pediades]|uniref:Berberine/berberine-like domain-containing protein n=1 Tax=Agrocybe pediades TaxID=84607 RepID=A0A8H4VS19_9AGAR|nr:hypothetical protein D9613_011689 [Agrocybe pediades]
MQERLPSLCYRRQGRYGDNYHRLQKVKDAWDPTNFFHFDQSIELTGTKNHRKNPVKHSPLHGGFVIPFAGHPDPATISRTDAGPGAGDATSQTEARWDAYSIHDPSVLRGVTNPKEIYKINGVERLKTLTS